MSFKDSLGKHLARSVIPGPLGLGLGLIAPRPQDPFSGWVTRKISEKILEVVFNEQPSEKQGISETDTQQILSIIERGRQAGVDELDIKISKNLAGKLEGQANLPVEGIPVNCSARLERMTNRVVKNPLPVTA